mmetsp:Transcript_43946/g.61077  ORF Transcript_43946/g.61077 Transcript_43946/m.61077 type:complete len:519 (-) Transcript_43946:118-1674(-)
MLQGLQIGKRMDRVRLQNSLLVPLVPCGDKVEVLVDSARRMMAHVAERLLERHLELLRACTVALAAATHAVVEARRGAPILRPRGHEVLIFAGRRASTSLADRHEVEAGVEEAGHELRAASPAHRPQEVDAIEAVLLGKLVPVVHHRPQLVTNLLREVDGEDGLVVDLLVEAVLEIRQQVFEVLLPSRLVAVVLVDQDLPGGMLAIAALPAPVCPGEEEGHVRLTILEHHVRDLPHDAAVLHALAAEPVVVEHEAMNSVLLSEVRLVLADLPVSEVIVVQATHLCSQRLPELVGFVHERLQVRPFGEALAVERVVLRKLVVLREVDGHDLRSHGKLSDVVARAAHGGDGEVPQLRLDALELGPDRCRRSREVREGHGVEASPIHVAADACELVLRDIDVGTHLLEQQLRCLLRRIHRSSTDLRAATEKSLEESRSQVGSLRPSGHRGASRSNEIQLAVRLEVVERAAHLELRPAERLHRQLSEVRVAVGVDLQHQVVLQALLLSCVQLRDEVAHVHAL